ncbi:MAG: hypothetical protein RLZZ70_214 [Candidatus Parcubacteria bacterium]|jgi:hypothetical protein
MMQGLPEIWGDCVRSYQRPYHPQLIWFITSQYATLSLGEQLELFFDDPKVIGEIAWVNNGMLIIIWAAKSLDGITKILTDAALMYCIPTKTFVH